MRLQTLSEARWILALFALLAIVSWFCLRVVIAALFLADFCALLLFSAIRNGWCRQIQMSSWPRLMEP